MLTKNSPIQIDIKSVSDSGVISGYGSVFGNVDSHRDIVVKGAFEKTMAAHKAAGTMPKMLWAHDPREFPIGSWLEMREDDRGLFVKGQLAIDEEPLADRVYKHVKAGRLDGLSIGFIPKEEEWDNNEGANLIKEVDLWEVSVVTFASNNQAQVTSVKDISTIRDLESLLRDARSLSRKEAAAIASRFTPKEAAQRDVVAADSDQAVLSDLLSKIRAAV